MEDWKNGLPPAFSYSSIQSANPETVFSDTYHVYTDAWTAGLWNLYRCARILTQEVITSWFDRNSSQNLVPDGSQQRQSEVSLVNLAHEICASVPFILGASYSSACPSRSTKATTGVSLLWPLYVAATVDPEIAGMRGMRAWVITRLELIGRTMGLQQAESLANVLRTKREITAWDKFEKIRADEVLDDW